MFALAASSAAYTKKAQQGNYENGNGNNNRRQGRAIVNRSRSSSGRIERIRPRQQQQQQTSRQIVHLVTSSNTSSRKQHGNWRKGRTRTATNHAPNDSSNATSAITTKVLPLGATPGSRSNGKLFLPLPGRWESFKQARRIRRKKLSSRSLPTVDENEDMAISCGTAATYSTSMSSSTSMSTNNNNNNNNTNPATNNNKNHHHRKSGSSSIATFASRIALAPVYAVNYSSRLLRINSSSSHNNNSNNNNKKVWRTTPHESGSMVRTSMEQSVFVLDDTSLCSSSSAQEDVEDDEQRTSVGGGMTRSFSGGSLRSMPSLATMQGYDCYSESGAYSDGACSYCDIASVISEDFEIGCGNLIDEYTNEMYPTAMMSTTTTGTTTMLMIRPDDFCTPSSMPAISVDNIIFTEGTILDELTPPSPSPPLSIRKTHRWGAEDEVSMVVVGSPTRTKNHVLDFPSIPTRSNDLAPIHTITMTNNNNGNLASNLPPHTASIKSQDVSPHYLVSPTTTKETSSISSALPPNLPTRSRDDHYLPDPAAEPGIGSPSPIISRDNISSTASPSLPTRSRDDDDKDDSSSTTTRLMAPLPLLPTTPIKPSSAAVTVAATLLPPSLPTRSHDTMVLSASTSNMMTMTQSQTRRNFGAPVLPNRR